MLVVRFVTLIRPWPPSINGPSPYLSRGDRLQESDDEGGINVNTKSE